MNTNPEIEIEILAACFTYPEAIYTIQDYIHSPNIFSNGTNGAIYKVMQEMADKPVLLMTGVSEGKKVEEIVRELAVCAKGVICTKAKKGGATSKRGLTALESSNFAGPLWAYPVLEEGLTFALDYAKEHEMDILIAGSLYLVVEASYLIKGKDVGELNFF